MLARMNAQGPRQWRLPMFALLLAGMLAGCAQRVPPATARAEGAHAPVVHDLGQLEDLTAYFDRDREHPRIVLLLSPT